MKTLKIDDTYSLEYDPDNNDRPGTILRHGERWVNWDGIAGHSNFLGALFFALLEREQAPTNLTSSQLDSLQSRAALLANLEGIGEGDQEATLGELQSLGTDMLRVLEDGEELDRAPEASTGWWLPTVDEVRKRGWQQGCGITTANHQLSWENIQAAMPDIIEKQDFTRLAQVVGWMLARNQPSTY